MANKDRKRMAHKEPNAYTIVISPSILAIVITLISLAVSAGIYLTLLGVAVSQLNTEIDGDGKESRIDVIERNLTAFNDKLSKVSNYLASETFNTVYVFKHTFDFPNPPFNVSTEEEARAIICTLDELHELPTADDDLSEKERYKKVLSGFDDSVELKFYTMSNVPPPPPPAQLSQNDARKKPKKLPNVLGKTYIRLETACYGGNDIPVTPAPVRLRLEGKSTIDTMNSDIGSVKVSEHKDILFEHINRDLVVRPFVGLGEPVPQVHSLTATVVDLEGGSKRSCNDYEVKAAAGSLDRCDFEVVVFTYDLPTFAVTEE